MIEVARIQNVFRLRIEGVTRPETFTTEAEAWDFAETLFTF